MPALAFASTRTDRLAWLLLLLGIVLSCWLADQVRMRTEADAVLRFSFAADQVTAQLEERLDAYALVLRGGAGLFDASSEVTLEEWHTFAQKMRQSRRVANIHGIGFAQYVTDAEREAHQQAVRNSGFPDYRIWPEGERPVHASVLYLEPFEGRNRQVFGYDMWSDPARQEAMIQARQTGRPAMTGRIRRVMDLAPDGQAEILMFVPVYRQNQPLLTPEQREEALIGWTFSPCRMDELMEGILSGWEREEMQALGLHIHDGRQPGEGKLLFSNHIGNNGKGRSSIFYQERQLDFYGRHWLLVFDQLGAGSGISYLAAWITLLGGLTLSGMVFWLMRLMIGVQVRAEQIARRLTHEIHQRHEETRRFRKALDYVSSCIYMKDIQCRYTYANQATLDLLGVDAETLQGSSASDYFPVVTADYLHQVDNRTLQGHQISEEVEIPLRDGSLRHYLEIKTPIFDEHAPDRVLGLLGIATDISALKEHEQQLKRVAHYDALTGLPNRVLLADRLGQAMIQAQRRNQRVAVIYLDLDGFKAINDSHGHAVGDEMLRNVAQRMKEALREGDTLSRLGGDEFVAVLLDLPDVDTALPLLQRLLDAASRPVMLGSECLQVTASLGVTFYPQAEILEADQLLRQADQAMYQAKLAGKNRYHLFDDEQDRSMRSHHESLDRLKLALLREEFVLYFQPKVNMRSGQVIGLEALIRWQHPERGLLLPGDFLPVLEEHPLAVQLGEWVIDAALRQMAAWQAQGLHLPISVNVGARQLRQGQLPVRLKAILARYPAVDPDMLELEVLETSALGDLAQVAELLEACRALGVAVSLDDFGTGYSSLTYLKRLPAGIVKVDQSFIRDILDNPEDLAILNGVMSLAAAFGRQVIAEGVETLAHGDMLLRIGCELAQGYGIARPMPAEQVPGWVSGWQPCPRWANLTPVRPQALPLIYAALEHRAWVQALLNSLEQPEYVSLPTLDESLCRFGNWLESSGFGVLPEFQPIDQLHREIHQLARRIDQLQLAGQGQAIVPLVTQLLALRDELLAHLDRLLDQV